jgi:diguanylate cyclase (GGDEF)-like protein
MTTAPVRLLVVLLTALFGAPSLAAPLAAPTGQPILVVTGSIANTNNGGTASFDLAMLEEIGMVTLATATPWYTGVMEFEGVPMQTLMRTVGAEGTEVVAVALNDYRSTIPMSDFEKYQVVLATRRNGQLMPIRDKGPLFIIYPFDSAAELRTANVRRHQAAEFELEQDDGRIIALAQQPMEDGGWVATCADVTEQRRAQARIAHMARHDELTNLPNRYAFRERIQEVLNASRADGSMLAVMCLDLDNFKEVNDTLGHPTGDALLCAVAERLVGCVRETDMVARFGGDEFAILQLEVGRLEDAERLASRLVDEMRRPFLINGDLVYSAGSVGIAISPKHGNDPVVLQKNADLALYAAKAERRRTYRFFKSEMDEQLVQRHVLERDLRRAIPDEQLHLRYQPIMHLRSRRAIGFEALLRWAHPVHGAFRRARLSPSPRTLA